MQILLDSTKMLELTGCKSYTHYGCAEIKDIFTKLSGKKCASYTHILILDFSLPIVNSETKCINFTYNRYFMYDKVQFSKYLFRLSDTLDVDILLNMRKNIYIIWYSGIYLFRSEF